MNSAACRAVRPPWAARPGRPGGARRRRSATAAAGATSSAVACRRPPPVPAGRLAARERLTGPVVAVARGDRGPSATTWAWRIRWSVARGRRRRRGSSRPGASWPAAGGAARTGRRAWRPARAAVALVRRGRSPGADRSRPALTRRIETGTMAVLPARHGSPVGRGLARARSSAVPGATPSALIRTRRLTRPRPEPSWIRSGAWSRLGARPVQERGRPGDRRDLPVQTRPGRSPRPPPGRPAVERLVRQQRDPAARKPTRPRPAGCGAEEAGTCCTGSASRSAPAGTRGAATRGDAHSRPPGCRPAASPRPGRRVAAREPAGHAGPAVAPGSRRTVEPPAVERVPDRRPGAGRHGQTSAAAPAAPRRPAPLDLDELDRDLWNRFEKRMRIEQERRGRG